MKERFICRHNPYLNLLTHFYVDSEDGSVEYQVSPFGNCLLWINRYVPPLRWLIRMVTNTLLDLAEHSIDNRERQ